MEQLGKNKTNPIQRGVAIALLVFGAYTAYKFLNGLVGIQQVMESRGDQWHYTEEDYYWSNILWARHRVALNALLLITEGIGLLKNSKYAWAIAWPTCLMIAFTCSVTLTIPYADTMKVEFDGRWFRLFFLAAIHSLLAILMLWPSFWRAFKINWIVILLSIALLALLVFENKFYFEIL